VQAASPRARVDRKLLLFGIDGATWSRIDLLLARGELPNLRRLVEGGVRAPLRTMWPTLSPIIWTTIATGVGPMEHGILWFTTPVPGTNRSLLASSNLRRTAALWNVLSAARFRVGVVGWWATYPAEAVNGFVISDQASSVRRRTFLALAKTPSAAPNRVLPGEVYPPALGDELGEILHPRAEAEPDLLQRFVDLPPEHLAKLQAETKVDTQDIFSILQFSFLIDRSYVEAGLRAIAETRPDFAAVYFNGLDAAEHHFWKYIDPGHFPDVTAEDRARYGQAIDRYYGYMDEVLGRYLALYPPGESTVLVVSDHGMERNASYDPASRFEVHRVSSGTHDYAPDGIFLAWGRDIVPGATLAPPPTVLDVAPTVLALMGLSAGSDMGGRALDEMLAQDFLAAHPPGRGCAYPPPSPAARAPLDSRANDDLVDRLRALGYIR
jgi:predicted AlkP superfamily phosphohydrolase/phosphomutase